MLKYFFLFSFVWVNFFTTPSHATETQTNYVLKVTHNSDQTLTFEKCLVPTTHLCTNLGPKQKYTKEELLKTRSSLKRSFYLKATGVTIATLAVFATSLFIIVKTTITDPSNPKGLYQLWFKLVTSNIGGATVLFTPSVGTAIYLSKLKAVSPLRAWKKLYTLNDALLDNQSYKVKDMNLFVELLEENLNTLK